MASIVVTGSDVPDDGRGELRRGLIERIDNDRVIEPQMQRDTENDRQGNEALQSGDERLFDPSGQLQIAPYHDVHGAESDDRGLQGRCHFRRVGTDIARELAVQPGPESLKESHGVPPL